MKRDVFAIRDEVFSDGTNLNDDLNGMVGYVGDGYTLKTLPSETLEMAKRGFKTGHRIKANPGAAEVWLAERRNGAPWRERAERIQQVEDEKAKREYEIKRANQSANQVCIGLKTVYNANFEPSELAPLLIEAAKTKAKAKPDPKQIALLQAVQRYDLKSVSRILGCYDKSKPPVPSLSITTRMPRRPKP